MRSKKTPATSGTPVDKPYVIEIIEDNSFKIDRSLNSDRFRLATGYEAPNWPELIDLMHAYK